MFANMAAIEALHVAYRGAASMTGVMGGESDLTIAPLPAVIGFIRSGRVKPIAVTGLARSAILPELPTMDESGVKGYSANGWSGLLLPKGTPPEIMAKLTEAITKVLAEDTVKEQIRRAGGEPWVTSAAEMATFMREEFDRYGEVVRVANIKLE
jgi:tripartite-type tricarboxylate transporter receptor subunit TctC